MLLEQPTPKHPTRLGRGSLGWQHSNLETACPPPPPRAPSPSALQIFVVKCLHAPQHYHLIINGKVRFLFELRVNTAKAFKKIDDLHVELKLLLGLFWVADGQHGT